jgi:hypothetical protein
LGKLRSLAAGELAARQKLRQTDMAKAPVKLARRQFDSFCVRMQEQGTLKYGQD